MARTTNSQYKPLTSSIRVQDDDDNDDENEMSNVMSLATDITVPGLDVLENRNGSGDKFLGGGRLTITVDEAIGAFSCAFSVSESVRMCVYRACASLWKDRNGEASWWHPAFKRG
jgi:hypothetical protein